MRIDPKSRAKLVNLRKELATPVPYSELDDLEFFTVGRNKTVFHKMGAAFAINTRTGKDSIFDRNAKVLRKSMPHIKFSPVFPHKVQ